MTGLMCPVGKLRFPTTLSFALNIISFHSLLHSPLKGYAEDWVEMVVKVHRGTVLGDEFAAMLKMRPQNSPTMHFDNYLDTGLPRNIKVATQTQT